MTADLSTEHPFRILVVCTGNICRSPFAERLLRAALGRIAAATGNPGWADVVEVASAGTAAMVGSPIEPAMLAHLAAHDADALRHAARQLERAQVETADLVLGLSRSHRRAIVAMLPRAGRRTFALNEFARLLDDAIASGAARVDLAEDPRPVLETLVLAAGSRRGFALAPEDPSADDVPDPYGRAPEVYESATTRIAQVVDRIEGAILAAAGVPR